MAIITNGGRAAIASAMRQADLYLAWGRGDGVSIAPPQETRQITALQDEIGRRKITTKQFCAPQADGEIIMQGARFTPSTTPTRNLHLRCEFDFDDGLGQTIRELGIFLNPTIKAGLPAGQRYFAPTDLDDAGILLALDNITAIDRGTGARISFDFVLTF